MQTKYFGQEFIGSDNTFVVMCPGFLGSKDGIIWSDLGNRLEQNKIASVVWDPTDNNFPKDIAQKFYVTNWSKDLNKLIQDLEKQNIFRKNIILVGNSMGGVLASFFASLNSIKGLVIISSPFQIGNSDDLEVKYCDWRSSGYQKFISSTWGEITVPFKFITDAKKYNVLDICQNIKCPKLFIAGDCDKTVPFASTKKIFDKCKEPKQWHLIKDMNHKYKNNPKILNQVNTIIVDFIATNDFYSQ